MNPGDNAWMITTASLLMATASYIRSLRKEGRKKRKSRQGRHRKKR
ncbi:hypothetical protein [Streptomyces sp. NPDC005953]